MSKSIRHKQHQLDEHSFDKVLRTLKNERFLQRKVPGNDLPFFICPFSASIKDEAFKLKELFKKELDRSSISVLDVNIYDALMSVLERNGYLEMLLDREGSITTTEFREVVEDLSSLANTLIPYIAEQVEDAAPQILFLSGLGESYPLIRPHAFMSHFQGQLGEQLTVMFFPGTYSYTETEGATLDLFGRRQEERYYRAFNIFEYEV